ncbi:acyl transferase/acyl hydrolase/lysophospholipase [Morchella snyderi]|nr:acyl transferase/acyl hydrolase/lysophospholipase [Morchella snyderi]
MNSSTSLKIGLGALVTATVLVTFYQTQSRRRKSPGLQCDSTTEFPALVKVTPDLSAQLQAEQESVKPLPVPDPSDQSVAAAAAAEQKDTSSDYQWLNFSSKLLAAKESIISIEWGKLTDLTHVFPTWAVGLPEWITKLQRELNMEPGSLAGTLWEEAKNSKITPEIEWDARVRQGKDLCAEEQEFLTRRRAHTKKALANYLGIPETKIHEDDVPVIAITGSGGGLRAMVAGTGYYRALTRAGLYDCATYTAGVSGSCWLQALYLTSIGDCSFDKVLQHIRERICVHIAYPPKALELLTAPPANKYLLRGVVERLRTGYSSFGLVDLYGLLLGARLLVPSDETKVNDQDLKLSNQKRYLENGEQPLPIYTAVRHEIPFVGGENEKNASITEEVKEKASKSGEAWFQWFEVTPFEFFCEDLEAGIPTWSMGRRFEGGVNVDREVPEMKLPLLLGIFGSAFCATLSHYYAEIRPFVTSINLFLALDKMVLERNNDLSKVHPIDPAQMPNFVKGLKDSLPDTCPESLYESEGMKLMDAGMSNNLACYPLLRRGRNVDILLAFDSSADIQTANWLGFAEGYAKQRKVQGWPVSIGWPKEEDSDSIILEELESAQAHSASEAKEKLEEAQREDEEAEASKSPATKTEEERKKSALGYCTVWVGSKEERSTDEEPPPSKAVEEDWELMDPDAGITVAYFPLIPNEKAPGVEPERSPYLSTWNFEWTPEEVDKTVALAQANFDEGADKVKRTVRAVYERKKRLRLKREAEKSEEDHEETRRRHSIHDHFS